MTISNAHINLKLVLFKAWGQLPNMIKCLTRK
jgi:hypothetical protein